ncbi:MAG: hypothetical protein ACRDGJ_12860, partial [Candidatus Limnocylindria bacterium]
MGSGTERIGWAIVLWLAVCLILVPSRQARADEWYGTLYGGQFSGSHNGDVLAARVQDSYAGGFGVLWEWEES